MSDTPRRAGLLIKAALFLAVMLYGWACGTTPLAGALAADLAHRLQALFASSPASASLGSGGALAPAFRPEVRRWESQILAWGATHKLDPDLVATIMQVESCGDPQAESSAGAHGLFQVMPYHFAAGEDMQDPETNAARGLSFFAGVLQRAGGDVGLALAAYNGGEGVIRQPVYAWPAQTRDYHEWTTGIYAEVKAGQNPSPTLERWLAAGGASLCQQAAARAR